MNILLTGAAGLIGMALRPVLAARGHHVLPIDITTFGRHDDRIHLARLDDSAVLDALIRRNDIEAIVHCGAISGPMMAKGEPLAMVSVNVNATALLLDLARRHGLKRFVLCSSMSVYGSVGRGLITEATPLRPTSVYAATKASGEQLLRAFVAEYGLSGAALRIGRVYGPYRRANCYLSSIIKQADGEKTVAIPCDPNFIYHYVYVDDVAEALAAALEAPTLPHLEYNVGAGEAMTMPQIADVAREVFPKARIVLTPGQDDVPDIQQEYDIGQIAGDLNWRPRYSLDKGLRAYHGEFLAGAIA